jgi:uncharacterized membrane protein (UPF0127 family)
MRILIAVLVPLTLILFLVTNQTPSQKTTSIELADQTITAEVADNSATRAKGLMNRDHLDENAGMWFVFDSEGYPSFWMKNTLIPLDMVWVNSAYEIVHIEENVQPCGEGPCLSYKPSAKSKYVLELNAGWVEKHGVSLGQTVKVDYDQ